MNDSGNDIFVADDQHGETPIADVFDGVISQLIVWKGLPLMGDGNIQRLAAKPSFETALQIEESSIVIAMRMNEVADGVTGPSSADFIRDTSGSGNHGTLIGDSGNRAEGRDIRWLPL